MPLLVIGENGLRLKSVHLEEIVKNIIERTPAGKASEDMLDNACAINYLCFEEIDEPERTRLLAAMKQVVEDTLSGRIPGWKHTMPDEITWEAAYLRLLAEIKGYIEIYEASRDKSDQTPS